MYTEGPTTVKTVVWALFMSLRGDMVVLVARSLSVDDNSRKVRKKKHT